ncbi:MAG: hypothetical protein QXD03_05190 [Candidatus Anstonellales archaeon]
MLYTMVMCMGCLKSKDKLSTIYTLVGEDYSLHRISGTMLFKALMNKEIKVTNMDVVDGKLEVTNGAFDKYTFIDINTGLVDKVSPVILNRIEVNDKLVGYTIFSTKGNIQEVSVKDAVAIHKVTPFSNGKIRHTQSGDIISSIVGNYPLRVLEIKKAINKETDMLDIDVVFIGSSINGDKGVKYVGLILNSNSMATISKYREQLEEENKKVLKAVKEIGGENADFNGLTMQITGTAGFYGVYEYGVFRKLLGVGKVTSSIDKLMVSCIDYKHGGKESRVAIDIDNNFSIVEKIASTEEGKNYLLSYLREIEGDIKMLKSKTA